MIAKTCLSFLIWAVLVCPSFALEAEISGQFSAWLMPIESGAHAHWYYGLRYIPRLDVRQEISPESLFDLEISLNGFWADDSSNADSRSDVKLYRAKLRYSTARTETRLGLQKIAFGPARLLRPLMWFDQIDPTDPLQLTEGVYALRFRYDSPGNMGLYLWTLYGNDDLKGFEQYVSNPDTPELGGRIQIPAGPGEIALTVHNRTVDGESLKTADFNESRIALDGQWDVGLGLWFETALQHQDADAVPYKWTWMTTIGLDYTFGLGNGLYVLFEHLAIARSDDPAGWDDDEHVSALMADYPLNISDRVNYIAYWSWDREQFSQYISWRRTYDSLIVDTTVFHATPPSGAGSALPVGVLAGGYGFGGRIMLIFNH